MDKQTLSKLKLMLLGLSSRLSEESDYFVSLKGDLKSGTRSVPFKANLEGELLKMSLEGRTEQIAVEAFPDWMVGIAAPYEKMTLIYQTRGESLTIDADSKNVQMKTRHMEEDKQQLIKGHSESGLQTERDYYIKVGKADALLKEIGILAENGKVKNDMIRKYNQIDHFVELLDPMLRELAKGRTELRIVDCACGKSYLSFVLNYYIKEVLKLNCMFTGIDIAEGVIESSKAIAQRLGYRNMNFVTGDIRSLFYVDEASRTVAPDLVISLHACDVATDFAMAYGIRNKARGIAAVPCCHAELLGQFKYEPFKDILRHGVLKARMADILTDGLRVMLLEAFGYNASIVEYVSPLDTPKNLLIRASLAGNFNKGKYEAYREMAKTLDAVPMLFKETQNLLRE